MTADGAKTWQQQLEEAFTCNGRVGGRSLPSLAEQEQICGAYCRDLEPDNRVLAECCLDFFATTLRLTASAYHEKGWPDDPCYGLCTIEFVAQFRGFRAAEILSQNGYSFEGYALLRDLKNQAVFIGAIAAGLSSFPSLYGLPASPTGEFCDELAQSGLLCRSVDEERTIFSRMIGETSGLGPNILALRKWNDLFNLQIHGSRSAVSIEMKAWSENKAHFSVGPRIDAETGAMYGRRFVEVVWMILRTLPFLQTEQARFTEEWRRHWSLLDQAMRLSVEAAVTPPEERPAAAFIAMIDSKFSGGLSARYAERV